MEYPVIITSQSRFAAATTVLLSMSGLHPWEAYKKQANWQQQLSVVSTPNASQQDSFFFGPVQGELAYPKWDSMLPEPSCFLSQFPVPIPFPDWVVFKAVWAVDQCCPGVLAHPRRGGTGGGGSCCTKHAQPLSPKVLKMLISFLASIAHGKTATYHYLRRERSKKKSLPCLSWRA